jgi:hypothetical protein
MFLIGTRGNYSFATMSRRIGRAHDHLAYAIRLTYDSSCESHPSIFQSDSTPRQTLRLSLLDFRRLRSQRIRVREIPALR